MDTNISGLSGREPIETLFEKRQKADTDEKVSGTFRASPTRIGNPLPGEASPVERVVKDRIQISREARAAAHADANNKNPGPDLPAQDTGKSIGEFYSDAIVDRLQDRLSGKKVVPEPTLLQRVFSSIRAPAPESKSEAPPPAEPAE